MEKEGSKVDTIWDLVKAQPITNRLYELNKAFESAQEVENRAFKKSGQIPPVPIKELAPVEGPAYAVTLSQSAKSVTQLAPEQITMGSETTQTPNAE